MTEVSKILSIATFISIATYLFWNDINIIYQIPVFYLGNAIFIFLLCLVIFMQNTKLFISFFLLCITLNNLLDELFFDPKTTGISEIIIVLILPLIWYLKINANARKNSNQ